MTLFQKQSIGMIGAFAAIIVVAACYVFLPSYAGHFTLPAPDTGAKLAFAAWWLIWPGLTLLAGIHGASRRGFFVDAIEGTRTPANQSLEINLRYNINTSEQLLLAAVAWNALAVTLPHDRLVFIPAMSILFVTGRILFWAGYIFHPMARTFGMTLTVIPTIAAFAWLVFGYRA